MRRRAPVGRTKVLTCGLCKQQVTATLDGVLRAHHAGEGLCPGFMKLKGGPIKVKKRNG